MDVDRWNDALDRIAHAEDSVRRLLIDRAALAAPSADRGRAGQCLEIAAADLRNALTQLRIGRALAAFPED